MAGADDVVVGTPATPDAGANRAAHMNRTNTIEGVPVPSMRNHLGKASVAQGLDGAPSGGEPAFPQAIGLAGRGAHRKIAELDQPNVRFSPKIRGCCGQMGLHRHASAVLAWLAYA